MNKTVYAASHLKGTLSPPPDKSISHRSALFAALHEGDSTISNYSPAADPQSTIKCLKALGVSIEKNGSEVRVRGVGRDGLRNPSVELDCGNSGTTMRLLTGILAGAGVTATLTGDESLSSRTMKRIIDPLSAMGADIRARNGDYAPLQVRRGRPLKPLHFELPIPSAQLKSSILLAGLFGEKSTTVVETVPSRDHTERLLQLPVREAEGKRIISSNNSLHIPSQTYRIPGDFSAAAFWLVAGAIHPEAEITLKGVGMNPTRTGALDILQRMEADISVLREYREGEEPVADLRVKSSRLKSIEITSDLTPNAIDELPVLAVAMAFAQGSSRISGAEELRHKETDRLMAIAHLLKYAGASFKEYEDGLEIDGDPDFQPSPAAFKSFHDHRIAMSAAVLAMMADGSSEILSAECAAVSYPSFWEDLKNLTN